MLKGQINPLRLLTILRHIALDQGVWSPAAAQFCFAHSENCSCRASMNWWQQTIGDKVLILAAAAKVQAPRANIRHWREMDRPGYNPGVPVGLKNF
jgi:hypothetical protein